MTFERGRPNSFPLISDEDDTGKNGQEVNCCKFWCYKVKHYQSTIIMNEDLL